MNNKDSTLAIQYQGRTINVPKAKIHEFDDYLMTLPAYSAANVDVHIGFIYSGNLVAIYEFMQWYEQNNEECKMKGVSSCKQK